MDLLAGKPSPTLKRTWAAGVLLACFSLLLRRPPSRLDQLLSKFDSLIQSNGKTPGGGLLSWKLVLAGFALSLASENLFLLLFLNPPEPDRGVYKKSFFRAQKILEALDAGFWTAMNISPAPLRHLLSLLFSLYFLLHPNKADDTCRRFRAQATVKHLRLSWEKGHVNPVLRAVTEATAPRIATEKEIMLPRPSPPSPSAFSPSDSSNNSNSNSFSSHPPIRTLLFFAGTESDLATCDALILHFPGGGFISMPPQVHAPYLRLWAAETGVPILSVDYGKAPEFPYPWALEECFDAYRSVVESNGGVIGLAGWSGSGSRNKKKKPIRIAIAGDSAGGNLAVATVYKILEFGGHYLPPPSGVLLTYPALSFEMAAWMPEDEIQLLRAESRKAVAEGRKAVNGNGNHKGGEKGKTVPGPPVMGTAAPGSSKEAGDGLGTSDLRRKRTLSFVERRYKFGPGLLTALADADAEPPVQTTRAVVPSRSATELRSLLDSPVVAVSPRRRKTGTPPPPPEPELPPVVQPPSFADRLWGLWDSLLLFRAAPSTRVAPPPATHKTVQMTSRMAFSGDKVLPPEIVRSLALLYVGNSPVPPDFGSDYMLNPNVAPDDLLARFPKVYLICGEKDPMVDDTVVFAGRVREAKVRAHREWRKLVDEEEAAAKQQHDGQGGLASGGRGRRWKASDLSRHVFAREPEEMVHTRILGGMSHGWLNLMGLLPEAKGIAGLNAGWLLDLLAQDDKTPRFPPFPGFAKTSGRDALACEELTEELMRRMESEDGGTIQGLVEVPARPGYYASVPAQIHRFSNPEASRGAVHGKKVLEKWEKQAGDMGVLDESSEGEDMEEKAGEVAAIRATAAAAQAMQARAAKRASVTRSKLLLNPGDESEESSDDDAPIVMRTIKPASSLVYPTAAAAEAELDAVSDAELIKRRKEEVEHALTHFHLNKGDDHRP